MKTALRLMRVLALFLAVLCLSAAAATGSSLEEVRQRGVLRHLGIPYANFITGQGDGLDVELIKLFAAHLGVRYEFVPTDWGVIIGDLTGKTIVVKGADVQVTGQAPIKGDVLANGLTVLAWRENVLDFSTPTFPTQVWLVVKSDSPLTPVAPTGDLAKDIALTRGKIQGLTLLTKAGTCLDPNLFDLPSAGAQGRLFPGSLNDLAPAVIMGEAGATLLDVPDALVALQKYPGKIKIVGPMSGPQEMAVGFAKESAGLREEFNRFFQGLKASGRYAELVRKYFPLVFDYFPGFFAK